MEEEKSSTSDHQPEPADQGAADVPIYYHVTIFDEDDEEEDDNMAAKEEMDRKNRAAAIAADEKVAHRLYMEQLMAMEEWQLRDMDRPSLKAALEMPLEDFPTYSSSRAGIGAKTATPGKFWAGTPPYELNSKDSVSQPYVQDEEIGAVGNLRIPGPLETLADKRIQEIRATLNPGNTRYGSSSRPTVPANNDPVSTKRQALLAEADSAIIFAGMEEGENNSWYDSMVVPDDDEKLEQVEVQSQSLSESLQRSEPCNLAATVAQGHEFSLQDFCVTPSDMNPDEPVQSTWPPKVPPLADHEIPTFDCGPCKDTLPVFDVFHGLLCKHMFCAPCMTTYVEGRIRAGELPIPCPDPACGGREWGGVLHPEKCKKGIDYTVFNDWGARLAERAVPQSRRAYCPNGRCGLWVETSGVAELFMPPCPECGHTLVRKPPGA